MAGACWTEDEDRRLTLLWDSTLTVDEITGHLPGRSRTSVQVHAKRLGLRHTKEQFNRILSKTTSGNRNGMWGKAGPRRGVPVTPATRAKLRTAALDGFASGRRTTRCGADNPAFGKPSSMRGRTLPDSAKATLSRKFRERWDAKSDAERAWCVSRLQSGLDELKRRPSKIEVRVQQWLTEQGTAFSWQAPLGFYIVDFLVKDTVIEVHGDYWHANPKVYPNPTTLNQTQRQNLRRDHAKESFLLNRGYTLVILWETDIHKHPAACQRILASLVNARSTR